MITKQTSRAVSGVSPFNYVMSWDETLTKAKQWCGASSLRFSVSKSDAESRSITFTAASGSFYLTVPAREGAEEWVGGYIVSQATPIAM